MLRVTPFGRNATINCSYFSDGSGRTVTGVRCRASNSLPGQAHNCCHALQLNLMDYKDPDVQIIERVSLPERLVLTMM